ncbi:MAG: 1-acyl-sn-glycerol-3-phosphate acyltransferase [Elusimicrobia bacterium]|nr:1-acyl-sn-glycerol-3-phosphate acyltransferase [Elusimicrobiota bacterium]
MNWERRTWISYVIYVLFRGIIEAVSGFRTEGMERLRRTGKVIVAVNHRSLLDGPFTSMVIFPTRFAHPLAKADLFRIPVLSWGLKGCGTIPLDRSGGDSSGMRLALSALEKESCVVIYPQGTRQKTDAPGRAKPGVGLLAHHTGAPVVPARIRHTDGFPAMTQLSMTFGPEIHYHGDGSRQSYQAFADKVLEEIYKL